MNSAPAGPWGSETDWHPVSSKLIPVRLISMAIGTVPAVIGLGYLWWYAPTTVSVLVTIGFVLFLGLRVVMVIRAVRSWGYRERADELLVRHGLLIRRLSIVPYGRMQFVDVSAGPIERAFGLATVQLHTAAAATDAAIPGLEPETAARLRDRLAALGRTQSEGL
ncbi:MAG: PH domain-containing protein [Micromonosporaceae bacterium]